MALKPCGRCATEAMDELLDYTSASVKAKEKSPQQLAVEGNVEAAGRIAAAQTKRSRYDAAKLTANTDEDFAALMDAGGAPPTGGSLPPGSPYAIPSRPSGPITVQETSQIRINGILARLMPMRETFGRPIQLQVERAYEQSQETIGKLRASVMKDLIDHEIIPRYWYANVPGLRKLGANRPNLRLADEDSMEAVLRGALSSSPYSPYAPARALTAQERAAADKVRPVINALGQQINGGMARFLTAYEAAGRPMDVVSFMSTLIRRATDDRIMRPVLKSIEGAKLKNIPPEMRPLWNEWSGLLLGRPSNSERALSTSILKVNNFLAKLPGLDGVFGGRANPRAALGFSEALSHWFYAGGMGFRPSSALRNFLDLNQTMAELGPKWAAIGIARAWNPKGMKAAYDAKVFTSALEALSIEERQLLGGSLLGDFTQFSLKMFRGVDMLNRAASYHGGLAKFDHFYQRGMIDKLIDGSKLGRGVTVGARQDIRSTLRFHINNGNVQAARDMYARDISMNTQYAYGRANTPIAMQSPIGRMFGMFSQWPLNYVQLLKSWAEPGRQNAALTHIASTFALLYGAGQLVDINLHDWIGSGSLPSEFGLSSPPAKLIQFGGTGLLAGSKVIQAELFGGRYADDKSVEFAKRNLSESLRNFGYSSTKGWDPLRTTSSLGVPGSAFARDVQKGVESGPMSFILPAAQFDEPEPKKSPFAKALGRGGIPKFGGKDPNRFFLDKGFVED